MSDGRHVIVHTVTDKATGELESVTLSETTGGFAERITAARAGFPAREGGDRAWAALTCDGCGTLAELDYDDPQPPAGWVTDGPDLCPACARRQPRLRV